MEHTTEFFDAMIEHCKQARRVPVPCELHTDSCRETVRCIGQAYIYLPYRPRWFLIENPPEGLQIVDVKFGARSQYITSQGGVPASVYNLADALAMKDSPIEAWKRFEIDSGDALHVGENISVQAEFSGDPSVLPKNGVIRALWIGDEPKFRKWEAEVAGTIHEVVMGAHGPLVTVHTRAGDSIRVPIKPADIPYLMDKIGKAVKFTLETGDDR